MSLARGDAVIIGILKRVGTACSAFQICRLRMNCTYECASTAHADCGAFAVSGCCKCFRLKLSTKITDRRSGAFTIGRRGDCFRLEFNVATNGGFFTIGKLVIVERLKFVLAHITGCTRPCGRNRASVPATHSTGGLHFAVDLTVPGRVLVRAVTAG